MKATEYDRPLRHGVARMGGIMFVLAAGGSLAQAGSDVCVTCAEPAASYKCQVDRQGASVSPGALQLYCIRQLAVLGNHARCSAKRRAPGTCQGEPRLLVYGPVSPAPGPTLTIRTPSPGASVTSTPPIDQRTGTISRDDPGLGANSGTTQLPPSDTTQAQPTSPPPQTVKKGPPKTVAEMAKRAATASKRQMKKAGDAVTGAVKTTGKTVGDAASKTWNCVVSLFSKC